MVSGEPKPSADDDVRRLFEEHAEKEALAAGHVQEERAQQARAMCQLVARAVRGVLQMRAEDASEDDAAMQACCALFDASALRSFVMGWGLLHWAWVARL